VQQDLFDSPHDLAIDRSFSACQRTALDADSWVEVVPGWVSGSIEVFRCLAERVPWKQHYRQLFEQRFLEPRLTAEYREIRDLPHPALARMIDALSARYGVVYDSLWMNFYRDGRDSTGWHRDRFSCRRPLCIVPVVSFGATRRFLLKPRAGGSSIGFTPRGGDLIVMGGRCQEDWVHAVPKSPGQLAARISINFQSSAQARR
jgi:alkylated DNA repair dioxygenase AlkB